MEACVLCITLFGCVLTWLAFGLGRMAYLSVEAGGGNPKSGQAMETYVIHCLVGPGTDDQYGRSCSHLPLVALYSFTRTSPSTEASFSTLEKGSDHGQTAINDVNER